MQCEANQRFEPWGSCVRSDDFESYKIRLYGWKRLRQGVGHQPAEFENAGLTAGLLGKVLSDDSCLQNSLVFTTFVNC